MWLRVLTFDILDIVEFLELCRIFKVLRLLVNLVGSNDYPRPDDSTNKQLNNQQTFFRLFAKNTK